MKLSPSQSHASLAPRCVACVQDDDQVGHLRVESHLVGFLLCCDLTNGQGSIDGGLGKKERQRIPYEHVGSCRFRC